MNFKNAYKRGLALFLSLVLALSLAVPGLAAEEEPVTLDKLEEAIEEVKGTLDATDSKPSTEDLQGAVDTLIGNDGAGGIVAGAADIAGDASKSTVAEKGKVDNKVAEANGINAANDQKVTESETVADAAQKVIDWLDGTADNDEADGTKGFIEETKDSLAAIVADAEKGVQDQNAVITAQQTVIDQALTAATNAQAEAEAQKAIAESETATVEQKSAAADAAEAAAANAAEAAAAASSALTLAESAKTVAEEAVKQAEADYAKAVEEANQAIGELKTDELMKSLANAEAALAAAKLNAETAGQARADAEKAKEDAASFAAQANAAAELAKQAYDLANVSAQNGLKDKQAALGQEIKDLNEKVSELTGKINEQQAIIDENTAKKTAAEAITPDVVENTNRAVSNAEEQLASKAHTAILPSDIMNISGYPSNWYDPTNHPSREERTEWILKHEDEIRENIKKRDPTGIVSLNKFNQQIADVKKALKEKDRIQEILGAWNEEAKAALAGAEQEKNILDGQKTTAEETLNGKKDDPTSTGLVGQQTTLNQYMEDLATRLAEAKQKLDEANQANAAAAEAKKAADEAYDKYTAAKENVAAAQAKVAALEERLKEDDSFNVSALEAQLAKAKLDLQTAQDNADKAKTDKDAADAAKDAADKAAEDARKAAQDAIDDANNPSTDPGTGGTDPGTTIPDPDVPLADGTGADGAVTLEDQAVPLAGLISRQVLVSYLYTHEGSPDGVDAEGEYTLALAWAVANDIVDEEDDPEEVVTVAILRDVMTRYAKLLGVVFDVEIEGEDDMIVMNCDEILAAFYARLEDLAA